VEIGYDAEKPGAFTILKGSFKEDLDFIGASRSSNESEVKVKPKIEKCKRSFTFFTHNP
jgi:hypothetical protein